MSPVERHDTEKQSLEIARRSYGSRKSDVSPRAGSGDDKAPEEHEADESRAPVELRAPF